MPLNFTTIEAVVSLVTIIAFLVSVGKWIQMREAIASRVIEVDTQLKEITDWKNAHIEDVQGHLSRIDSIYVRKDNCGLHMINLDEKLQNITTLLGELKKSLDKHLDHPTRR